MSSSLVEIDVLKDNLEYRLGQYRPVLSAGKKDDAYFRALADSVARTRWLGVCLLLGQGDHKGFFSKLVESARLAKTLFQETRDHEAFSRYGLTSNYLPLLGAYIAGEDDLALQIAAVADRPVDEDYEYVEDHSYGRFFIQWLKFGNRFDRYLSPLLTTLEEIEEADSARFALIKALEAKDAVAFDEAMQAFVEEYADFYAGIEGTLSLDKEKFTVEHRLSIEALAWLKMASVCGLKVKRDYLLTPRIVVEAL